MILDERTPSGSDTEIPDHIDGGERVSMDGIQYHSTPDFETASRQVGDLHAPLTEATFNLVSTITGMTIDAHLNEPDARHRLIQDLQARVEEMPQGNTLLISIALRLLRDEVFVRVLDALRDSVYEFVKANGSGEANFKARIEELLPRVIQSVVPGIAQQVMIDRGEILARKVITAQG